MINKHMFTQQQNNLLILVTKPSHRLLQCHIDNRCKVQSAIFNTYYFKFLSAKVTVTSCLLLLLRVIQWRQPSIALSILGSTRLSMQRWIDWIRLQYTEQAAYERQPYRLHITHRYNDCYTVK